MTGKKKIPFDILDSIRGIASLYVAIAHCRGVLWIGGNEYRNINPVENWNIWEYAMVGSSMLTKLAVEFVIVFFLLSGFSIAHSLSGNKSPLSFYKRRFIRIYPPYVAALVWAGLVFVITRYAYPEWYDGSLTKFAFTRTTEMNNYFDTSVMLKNFFYMPFNGFITPFWSLTYEVIFYLLAPFVLLRANIYIVISVLLFGLNIFFPGMIKSWSVPLYLHNFIFVYNIYFALGVALYNYYEPVMQFFSLFGKKIFILLIFISLGGMYGLNFYTRGETAANFMISAVFSILLITFFTSYKVRVEWLIKVGQFSYTLYITHFASIYLYLAFYWWLFDHKGGYILNYFVWMPAVFFCLAIAYMHYRLVENKTKKILVKIRSKK